jgi:hypothetical protein
MENYKPFITKWFVSLIGDKTSLQLIKILRDTGTFKLKSWNAKGITFFHIYTFVDSDVSSLIGNSNNFQFCQDVCVKSWLFPFKNFMLWRRSCHLFFFMGTKIIIPYSLCVCKTVGWANIGHHFESPTVATTTWFTAMAYLCHKWPRICSTDMGPFSEKNTNPETFWNNFDNIIFSTNLNTNPDPNHNPNTNLNPNRTRFGFP